MKWAAAGTNLVDGVELALVPQLRTGQHHSCPGSIDVKVYRGEFSNCSERKDKLISDGLLSEEGFGYAPTGPISSTASTAPEEVVPTLATTMKGMSPFAMSSSKARLTVSPRRA